MTKETPMKALAALVNAVTLAAVIVILASPADAQKYPCGVRAEIIADFARRHQEQVVATGLTATGTVIEVLASSDGKTWTVLVSNPVGFACINAVGTDWEPKAPKYGEQG